MTLTILGKSNRTGLYMPTQEELAAAAELIKKEKQEGKVESKEKKSSQKLENLQELNGFIYVPSIDRFVTDHRILLGKSYNDVQSDIVNTKEQGRKLSILTPYQFREFIRFLMNSPVPEYQRLYTDITDTSLGSSKSEATWLNAKFIERDNGFYMSHENTLCEGRYLNYFEIKLEKYVTSNKKLSLGAWINSNLYHGLPMSWRGIMRYISPVHNMAAVFFTTSGFMAFYCSQTPESVGANFGVFACAEVMPGDQK